MLRNTSEYGKTTQWGRKRRGRRKMCLDVLGMHGEVEEVWSGVEEEEEEEEVLLTVYNK